MARVEIGWYLNLILFLNTDIVSFFGPTALLWQKKKRATFNKKEPFSTTTKEMRLKLLVVLSMIERDLPSSDITSDRALF